MNNDPKKINIPSSFREVFVPSFVIFFFVTVFLWVLYTMETSSFKNLSNAEIKNTTSLIGKRLQIALTANEAFRGFFESNQSITENEFETFASSLRDRMALLGLGLTFEAVDENNRVQKIYPLNETNIRALGQDLNTYPSDIIAINKAKKTRASVITEPEMVTQGYPALLIYTPIFKGDIYRGSAVCIIRISNLLSPTVGSWYKTNEHIQTDNFIIPFEIDAIYTRTGEAITDPQNNTKSDAEAEHYADIKNDRSTPITFVDKVWEFHYSLDYRKEVLGRMIIHTTGGYTFTAIMIFLFSVLHRRNKRLFQEEAQTAALISSIGEGLIAIDKNGIITYANNEAEKLSQYNTDEAIGKKYTEIWRIVDEKGKSVGEENHPFYKALVNEKKTEISTSSKLFMLRKDGTRFAFSSNITPIMGLKNKVEGVMITFKDNTKESEVDRMKTEFLSFASHQLLTPITAIKLISEMLTNEYYGALCNSGQKENIQNIHLLSERMSALIKALLNISRIESGRIIIDPKSTNLKDLINELLVEIKMSLGDKKQTCIVMVDPNLKEIHIDPKLIREVYKNFLTNAIKYTPAGGTISVEVTIRGDEVISKIHDTGYGIPSGERSKVFEKFYRGGNVTKIEPDGNGLGLYLVKQIVEVSEGKVWFESEENKGTTFWFSLPLAGNKAKAGEVTLG